MRSIAKSDRLALKKPRVILDGHFDLSDFTICLLNESFRLSILVFGGNITADAITGPAKAPLPTSSTPAIKILFSLKKFSLMV